MITVRTTVALHPPEGRVGLGGSSPPRHASVTAFVRLCGTRRGGGGGGGGELTQAGGEGPLRGTEEGRRAGDVQNHIIQSEL